MQRALQQHPWRVYSVEQADIIAVLANFSLWCVRDKPRPYSPRNLWHKLLADKVLYPPVDMSLNGSIARSPPKFVTLQYSGCKPPWLKTRKPADILLLKEFVSSDRLATSLIRHVHPDLRLFAC